LRLAQLLLHLQQLVAHFLDAAVEAADLLFELADPRIHCLGENDIAGFDMPALGVKEAVRQCRKRRCADRSDRACYRCETENACRDKFLHLSLSCWSCFTPKRGAQEFSKYTQKATEFGQSVLKKERRPRGRLSPI